MSEDIRHCADCGKALPYTQFRLTWAPQWRCRFCMERKMALTEPYLQVWP